MLHIVGRQTDTMNDTKPLDIKSTMLEFEQDTWN